ncbi:phasin family protein [Stappia sp. F7233]|uniref:Phasin family protein n=1 Tax=Stappia albiluteola TaxID=2758565 RepID=A0A839ABS3_9HYPH|nr:phasin family protein [Stappia albiluteola]MBA5777073.1 phasin family protein [Stappia albiluteola]
MRGQNPRNAKAGGFEPFNFAGLPFGAPFKPLNMSLDGPLGNPFAGPFADTMMETGQKCLDACLDWQEEIADFANRRLHADLDLQRSMVRCKSANELAKLHQDWATSTLSDFAAEAEKLSEILGQAALTGMQAAGQAQKTERRSNGANLHAKPDKPAGG